MSKGSWSAPECVFVLRQSFRSAVANGHAFKNLIFGVHNRIILFYECGCPQRRVVVLRHVAGDAADFQSVTFSSVPARGIQECSISSIDVNDSHLSGLVGYAPLLSCYDFHGLAHMQAIWRWQLIHQFIGFDAHVSPNPQCASNPIN